MTCCRLPVAANVVRLCVSAGRVCLRGRVCVYPVVFSTPPPPPPPPTRPLQCAQRQLLGAVSPQTPSCTQGAYSHSEVLVLRLLFVSPATDVQSAQFTRDDGREKTSEGSASTTLGKSDVWATLFFF